MGEEQRKILDMLAEGKITAEDAERLLSALSSRNTAEGASDSAGKAKPKYLRVVVDGAGGENVNIRVPLALLRSGIKLHALLPEEARDQVDRKLKDKGINLNLGKGGAALDDLTDALSELSVDIDGDEGEKVRVFCE